MKLIQLNIWGGKLMYALTDFLADQKPDIVCMQEVHDLKGPSGAVFFSLEEIRERSDFKYAFMSPNYVSNYQHRKNSFGNAILSNLEIKKTNTIFTHGEFNADFDLTEDDFNVRNLQHAVLEVGGRQLHVLNHHGYLIPDSKDGNEYTEKQMRIITDYISKLSGPLVLAGDFNLAPSSPSIKILDSALINLSSKVGLKSTYQKVFNSNDVISDYIFVNRQIKVNSFKMSDELVSDHKALILEFDL